MAEKRCNFLCGNQCAVSGSGTVHQRVSLKIAAALLLYVDPRNMGHVLQAPFKVMLSREVIVLPDILFVARGRVGLIGEKSMCGPPDLIIEVVPQDGGGRNLDLKTKTYSRFKVNEYWIADPCSEMIEVLLWSELGYVTAGVYRNPDRLSSPALPKFKLPLARVFSY